MSEMGAKDEKPDTTQKVAADLGVISPQIFGRNSQVCLENPVESEVRPR
jgi:hypothetical protein